MTYARPMFPPRIRGRAVPIHTLTPDQLEAVLDLSRLRKEAEAEVERLIAFLDMVDGYSLSECEPSLGHPEPNITPFGDCPYGQLRTDEGDQSDQRGFGVTDDRESSLLVPIEFIDRFGDRFQEECEEEHDGREPDVCDEPSLGSLLCDAVREGQEHWAQGSRGRSLYLDQNFYDAEHDDADLEPSLCGVTATAIPTMNGVEDGEDDAGDDREIENEHAEGGYGSMTVDDEPSLGGVGSHVFQPSPEAWRRDLDLEENDSAETVNAAEFA